MPDTAVLDQLTEHLTDVDHLGVVDPLDPTCPETIPCRTQGAELWFAEQPEGVEAAKALCRRCPAMLACLDGAVLRREPWGVWGGQLFVKGRIVERKRPRGRPRKYAA